MSAELHEEIEITVGIVPAWVLDSGYRREKVNALLRLFDTIAADYGVELSEEEISEREFEELDRQIDLKWKEATHKRLVEISIGNHALVRERDELKSEVDKQRKKEADERLRLQHEAINAELRARHYLNCTLPEHYKSTGYIVDALLHSCVPNAEDWEFSRWDFTSQLLSDLGGDQDQVDNIADNLVKVIKLL